MRDEVANGWDGGMEHFFILLFALLLCRKRQGSLEELEKRGFASILRSQDQDAVDIVSLVPLGLYNKRAQKRRNCAHQSSGSLLEWSRVLASANSPRVVDGAHSTAGIAVTTPVRHAL